ncbi:DMT family transporter [Marinovum sp. 2_MG-2023]|uniref:DMT family transporter n=1 Tax=Roseobacteraceae TaxID=2854170 RepID=UPI001FCFBEC9|nr:MULTISPECIES: DMT family transporter [Roseobacteraceae]MCJ7871899.1 DMT family transporter [Phaeobacter sp. J2-8]MDO6728758.1 DMT family transporter [Marinovum sp. 2_MG-2023]MDO6777826.1 DMT family transporter [Marinovum sp. 1_MG-2023]
MDLWIFVTLAAAFFQTLRFILQKHLSAAALSAAGATFARFVYSAPLVALGVAAYLWIGDTALPAISARFWPYAIAGGVSQILATVCVVMLFKSRNFAVGITFKKTEVIQTVLVGLVVLGEGVSPLGFGAILVGLIGVLVLSVTPDTAVSWRNLGNRAVALGLTSGLFFAISGVTYRGATLEIASDDPLLRAGVALAIVTAMQTCAMAVWLGWREPGEVARVLRVWRIAGLVGVTSMLGSLGWFTAFTLQNAAYVNALGQVELVFSILATVFVFREKISSREMLGISFLAVSILALVMVA